MAQSSLRDLDEVDEDSETTVTARPWTATFMCMREPAAFNLSLLDMAPGTPVPFVEAWRIAQSRTDGPGIVIAFTGTRRGPDLTMQIGTAHPASAGQFGFMTRLPPAHPLEVGRVVGESFRFRSAPTVGEFVAAMGRARDREGFIVSSAVFDGRFDANCEHLRDITVQLTLSAERNDGVTFGSRGIGEALGLPNIDTDGDGKPDSWRITLAGPALDAMDFKL